MNLYTKLQEREAEGRPIRVGLIGAGKVLLFFESGSSTAEFGDQGTDAVKLWDRMPALSQQCKFIEEPLGRA